MTTTSKVITWTHADPRLLTPPDLIHEHLWVHRLLVLSTPGPERDFLLFRHELLRIAANVRSGHRHAHDNTLTQRAHPSPVDLMDLRVVDERYHRALLIYERWCYVRKQRDVQTIDLLFHALMQKMPVTPEAYYGEKTPWAHSTPGHYLWQHKHQHDFVPAIEAEPRRA